MHAYTWQIKAVGAAPLSEIGLRPGFPLLGAVVGSILRVPAAQVLVVLPPVLAVVLGFGAAATVRLPFALPRWVVLAVAVVAATWAGTVRLVAGYEGTLLALVLLVAGVAALVHAAGRPGAVAAAAAMFLAACLSHVVFFGIFVAVLALYVVLSLPSLLQDRRDGIPLLSTDAAAAAAAGGGACLVGAIALFGWVGLSPGSSFNVTGVEFRFQGRTRGELRRIRPLVTVPVAAVGAAVALGARGGRSAGALRRLGLSWLLVAGAGAALGLMGARVPGNRALLFALPLPVLVGLAVSVAGVLVCRVRSRAGTGRTGARLASAAAASRRRRRLLAGVLVAAMVFSLASLGMTFFFSRIGPRTSPVWEEMRAAAAYVRTLPPSRPVVFVVNEPGPWGAFTPKLKLNALRASMPDSHVTKTFVYVGGVKGLRRAQPTLLPEDRRWRKNYNATSRAMFREAAPALAAGAAVLVVRGHAKGLFDQVERRRPERVVAPGVYVVRGPTRQVALPPRGQGFGFARAMMSAAGSLLLLALVGWRYARAALRGAGADALDVACLAPAFGSGLVVLAGFVVAAGGASPKGPVALGLVLGLFLGGTVIGRPRRSSLLR